MDWLRRRFGSVFTATKKASGEHPRLPAPPLALREDATLPIVNWEEMDKYAPVTTDNKALDEFWSATAAAWLDALAHALGAPYCVQESSRFLLLAPLAKSQGKSILDYVERTRSRILRILDGIANDSGFGKVCVLVFDNHDTYYQYVSNYYARDGEFALSGGMFLQQGYGHFVFVQDDMQVMEPTIAHELTHCLLQHLPLPAWLNEGIAVNTEHRLSPPPGRPLYTPEELQRKHLSFWNKSTMQEFWSGKSWLRPDHANMLSYDLAKHFVSMAAQNFDAFRAFVNAADAVDSGDTAAREHLGYPVAHLAEAVLGEGAWQPHPETWDEGVERGQFRGERAVSRTTARASIPAGCRPA